MDKTIDPHAEIDPVVRRVRCLPGGRREIHEKYGLWICGAYRNGVTAPAALYPRLFEFYSVSHMWGGRGVYWTPEGGAAQIRRGQVVITAPRHVHFYGGDNGDYVEDWVSFVGPVADHFLAAGIIENGVFDMGAARRLKPIVDLAHDPSTQAQIRANIELQHLLVDLYLERMGARSERDSPLFATLLEEIPRHPERRWVVTDMAQSCGLSEVSFRRRFRQRTGLSPKQYVDRIKISQAGEMLRRTRLGVSEVAERFAYDDPFHFSRRFKQITGLSPLQYRNAEVRRERPR